MQVEYVHQLMVEKHRAILVEASLDHQYLLHTYTITTTTTFNHHNHVQSAIITIDRISTSTGATGVNVAANNATCVRAHHIPLQALQQATLLAATGTPAAK